MQSNINIARFIDTLDRLDIMGKKIPGLILSHAGFGKTTTIEKFCEVRDYNFTTLIPSEFNADDILGLQTITDRNGVKSLVKVEPWWYTELCAKAGNGKRNILFVDELSATESFIQAPLLNLIFNQSIGDKKLPPNTFIVSAGNYPEDLDENFRLLSPTLNRFVILNLTNDMFDLDEVVDDKFGQVENWSKYLGLEPISSPVYDINLLRKWCKSSGEIPLATNRMEYVEEFGQLGFSTIRSVSFSLAFASVYMATYGDDLWARVCGDTLGKSTKRDKPLQSVLLHNLENFLVNNTKTVDISSLCIELRNNPEDIAKQNELYDAFNSADFTSIKQAEVSAIGRLAKVLSASPIEQVANFGRELRNLLNTKSGIDF